MFLPATIKDTGTVAINAIYVQRITVCKCCITLRMDDDTEIVCERTQDLLNAIQAALFKPQSVMIMGAN